MKMRFSANAEKRVIDVIVENTAVRQIRVGMNSTEQLPSNGLLHVMVFCSSGQIRDIGKIEFVMGNAQDKDLKEIVREGIISLAHHSSDGFPDWLTKEWLDDVPIYFKNDTVIYGRINYSYPK